MWRPLILVHLIIGYFAQLISAEQSLNQITIQNAIDEIDEKVEQMRILLGKKISEIYHGDFDLKDISVDNDIVDNIKERLKRMQDVISPETSPEIVQNWIEEELKPIYYENVFNCSKLEDQIINSTNLFVNQYISKFKQEIKEKLAVLEDLKRTKAVQAFKLVEKDENRMPSGNLDRKSYESSQALEKQLESCLKPVKDFEISNEGYFERVKESVRRTKSLSRINQLLKSRFLFLEMEYSQLKSNFGPFVQNSLRTLDFLVYKAEDCLAAKAATHALGNVRNVLEDQFKSMEENLRITKTKIEAEHTFYKNQMEKLILTTEHSDDTEQTLIRPYTTVIDEEQKQLNAHRNMIEKIASILTEEEKNKFYINLWAFVHFYGTERMSFWMVTQNTVKESIRLRLEKAQEKGAGKKSRRKLLKK